MLTEKWIDWFQQNRFLACYHVRELRSHAGGSVKVELVPIQTVLARHVHFRSGHLKMQRRKREQAI